MNIVIIGAGPAGLGSAYHLHKLGYPDWKIFEKTSYAGGLSASFVDDKGFTWDVGGHVLFSHYDYFDRAVSEALGDAYYEHLRESWIRILQTWVPYPFQNNIRYLPSDALRECIDGLQQRGGNIDRTTNFREWMNEVFGKGIVKYFMEPYNTKLWGVPLESMSRDWIGERVSVVDFDRIKNNIVRGRDDVSWGPNSKFRFPISGGTGAIFGGIARSFREHIEFGHEVEHVDFKTKKISFSNGNSANYDVLISTIPLDQFVDRCSYVPPSVSEAADKLTHNGGLIVGLGFAGKRVDSKCWMYFPENNVPFYRVTNFFNYSPRNVPGGRVDRFFSLICETSYSSHRNVDKGCIIEHTKEGLIASGIVNEIEARNVVSRYLIEIPYAYPIPTIGRDSALSVIQPYLESQGVYSRGRFGAWKYEVGNMDHSFMQGVEAVDRILFGKEERTVKCKM
jgi:protoporphyrinogen oxidase